MIFIGFFVANNRYTFVAEQWLSVETSVDVNLQSNNSKEKVQFESRFFFQTRDSLSESHMWVSIMYRPVISNFTRVQRASCALVYIFLTMIANAMYFNPGDEYQRPPLLQIGPLRFSTQQVMCANCFSTVANEKLLLCHISLCFLHTFRLEALDSNLRQMFE